MTESRKTALDLSTPRDMAVLAMNTNGMNRPVQANRLARNGMTNSSSLNRFRPVAVTTEWTVGRELQHRLLSSSSSSPYCELARLALHCIALCPSFSHSTPEFFYCSYVCLFYVCVLGCWNKICMYVYDRVLPPLLAVTRERGNER